MSCSKRAYSDQIFKVKSVWVIIQGSKLSCYPRFYRFSHRCTQSDKNYKRLLIFFTGQSMNPGHTTGPYYRNNVLDEGGGYFFYFGIEKDVFYIPYFFNGMFIFNIYRRRERPFTVWVYYQLCHAFLPRKIISPNSRPHPPPRRLRHATQYTYAQIQLQRDTSSVNKIEKGTHRLVSMWVQ